MSYGVELYEDIRKGSCAYYFLTRSGQKNSFSKGKAENAQSVETQSSVSTVSDRDRLQRKGDFFIYYNGAVY